MWSNIKCGFLAIRALATDTVLLLKLSNHLYFGDPIKTFGSFDLNFPTKSRRSVGKAFRFGAMGRAFFRDFSSSALHMAQNPLTVISLTARAFGPIFFAAASGSLMAAYFSIVNLSWVDHFWYVFRFSHFVLKTAETATSKSKAPDLIHLANLAMVLWKKFHALNFMKNNSNPKIFFEFQKKK